METGPGTDSEVGWWRFCCRRGEAQGGEVWMERRKGKKEKHREKENMKKWKKVKPKIWSKLMYYQSTNTAYSVSAPSTLNYIFCLGMEKVFGFQVFDIEHDATAEKRREQPHWHSPHSSDGRVQQTLHNCCDGWRLALQPNSLSPSLSMSYSFYLCEDQCELEIFRMRTFWPLLRVEGMGVNKN